MGDGVAAYDVIVAGAGSGRSGPDGSALVVHAAEDDLVTDPTGNSGARIACGVITAD